MCIMNYIFAIDVIQRIYKVRPNPLFYMHPFNLNFKAIIFLSQLISLYSTPKLLYGIQQGTIVHAQSSFKVRPTWSNARQAGLPL